MFAGGLSLGVVLGLALAVIFLAIVGPRQERWHPTIYQLDTNEHTRAGPALEYTAPEVLVLSPNSEWPDTVRSASRTNGIWKHLGGGRYRWKENQK